MNTEYVFLALLLKIRDLGYSRIFVEAGKILTTNFLKSNLVDKLELFISNYKLNKNGRDNIKNDLKKFLKNKKSYITKVNLFGEKLITYKIK